MGDQSHRRDGAVWLDDDRSQPFDASLLGHRAEFGRCVEPGAACVVTQPQRQMIVPRAQSPLVDQLHQRPHRPRRGAPAIEDAIAFTPQAIGDRIAIGVRQDRLFLLIFGIPHRFQA